MTTTDADTSTGKPTRTRRGTEALEEVFALGARWPTVDPFLFVAHHRDAYPNGTDDLAPDAPLEDRPIGADFTGTDGWSMYHGSSVPGFPAHPHRGFETVTYVRSGLIDHSDSLGATARFGRGDTQWMTAGAGVVHAEMFPLVNADAPNPTELFQIWLNLPADRKMSEPYFTMLWAPGTPVVTASDPSGASTHVTVIAGALEGVTPQSPPPDSWAARPGADVAIWHLRLDPGATWELPATPGEGTRRVLYAFAGDGLTVAGERLDAGNGALLGDPGPLELVTGEGGAECLLLQGRPIGEPVAQYGPFVMNDRSEIQQAMADYAESGFGGWPWGREDPVHPAEQERFARHPDGRLEHPSPTVD